MGLFHQLHRASIALGWAAAAGTAFLIWSQRAHFLPVVDLWRAVTIREGYRQEVRQAWEGEVVKIADPLTLTVRDEAGRMSNVRLTGVDLGMRVREKTIRVADPVATRQRLAALVLSNTVTLRVTHQHGVGSLLGLAEVNGTNVNVALVASGLAFPEERFMNGLPFRVRYDLFRAARRAETDRQRSLLPGIPNTPPD